MRRSRRAEWPSLANRPWFSLQHTRLLELRNDFIYGSNLAMCLLAAAHNRRTAKALTLAPPWRVGGASTLIVSNLGVKSTPRSSAFIFLMTFFFACVQRSHQLHPPVRFVAIYVPS